MTKAEFRKIRSRLAIAERDVHTAQTAVQAIMDAMAARPVHPGEQKLVATKLRVTAQALLDCANELEGKPS